MTSISRETGVNFVGPWILGQLAVTTENPIERQAALAEGEEILRKGAVSHNHLWFFRYAIDASLSSEDWDDAERYCAALENYTRSDPPIWTGSRCIRSLPTRTGYDQQPCRSGSRGGTPWHRSGTSDLAIPHQKRPLADSRFAAPVNSPKLQSD